MHENTHSLKELRDLGKKYAKEGIEQALDDIYVAINETLDDNYSDKDIEDIDEFARQYLQAAAKTIEAL